MPERIQRQRTKGWKAPAETVYVGRPTRWGNPFRHAVAIEAVLSYQRWLKWEGSEMRCFGLPPTREEIQTLAGKNLMCWCRLNQACHADVLLELANALSPSDRAKNIEQEGQGQ